MAPSGAPRRARSPEPSHALLGEHPVGLRGDRTRDHASIHVPSARRRRPSHRVSAARAPREQFPLRAGFRAYSPAIVSLCRRARFRRWLHNQGDVARIDRHSGRSADFLDELRDQGALPVSRSLPLPPTQDQERHPRRESRSLRSAIRRWSFASSRRRRPAPVLLRRSCDVRRRPRRSRWLRSAV